MRMVKRFEPISVMRIAAICYAVLGLLEGVIFSIFFATIPFAGKAQAKYRDFSVPFLECFPFLYFHFCSQQWAQLLAVWAP
jgi:hypothetical protein